MIAAAAAPASSRTVRIAWVLNTLATIQCIWFYLARVPPALNLFVYEQGHERLPFQQRMLLMFPLHYAHHSVLFRNLAATLNLVHGWFGAYSGHIQPEAVLEVVINLFCVVVTGTVARCIYKSASRTGLLTPFVYPLVLVMITTTYGIQANHPLRFLYDLPAMAFFSTGLALLYFRRSRLLFAMLFIIATINKETTLLLLPAYWLMRCRPLVEDKHGQASWRWSRLASQETMAVTIPLLGWWIGWHLWVVRHFADNASAAGPRLLLNLGTVLVPLSWPQLLSAAAYLWPLAFIHRKLIADTTLRAWTWLPMVWLAFMLNYGLLIETRIFGELVAYFACTSALVAEEIILARLQENFASKLQAQLSPPSRAEQREA